MKSAWCIVAALMLPLESRADHRFLIDPSLQVNEVNDDNLNYSIDKPLRDRVNRITPALDLRFDSPRLRVFGTYSLDSERYANHSFMNDDRARQRAGVDIKYDVGPRLLLLMQSKYIDTNTQADLNVDTGLAALRAHGRSLSVGSSARFRVSPRFTATVSSTLLTTNVINGTALRSQVRALILGERVTARDLFNIHYENNNLSFSGATSQRIHTQFFLARWVHQIGKHDSVIVQAGPRLTDGSPSVDVAAILSHTWRLSSIAFSYVRNQTTVVGYAGAVDSEMLQTKFSFAPNRRLTAYVVPAIYRSSHLDLEGKVYHVGLGARYAITPLLDAEVAYNHDAQNGGIDPSLLNAKFSHATLSVGFATRWNRPDKTR